MPQAIAPDFWKTKTLQEMTREEWESLCDGCAQCCLVKLEDEDTGEVFATGVACQLLDIEQCRCKDYAHRKTRIPSCLVLTPDQPEVFRWLPDTCAYRCLAEGRAIPEWHPLIQGNKQRMHELGISVKGYAISEVYVHPEQLVEHRLHKLAEPES
jgi:uncharacterized cysteine cluster protein YcgN (CxxCxxCC family)